MYASIDRCSNHFHEDPHDSECGLSEILILQKRHSNGSEIACHDHEILRLRCRSFDVFKIFIKISTHIKILLYIFHLSLGGFIIPPPQTSRLRLHRQNGMFKIFGRRPNPPTFQNNQKFNAHQNPATK